MAVSWKSMWLDDEPTDAGNASLVPSARINTWVVEMALHGDRLAFRHQLAAFAARTSVNQRASTVVLDDEFVAEHFGNLTLDRDGRAVLQLRDRPRLQQQDRLWPVFLDVAASARATHRA